MEIVLHVHAGAVNGRVVARRRIAEVLRLDLAPVNGGAGNRNAKLLRAGLVVLAMSFYPVDLCQSLHHRRA